MLEASKAMESTLDAVHQTVRNVLTHVCDRYESKVRLQFQVAWFRNYEYPQEMLLQCSDWCSAVDGLFSSTIVADGIMQKSQAVEIALQHANTECEQAPVKQVLLIGCSPPNDNKQLTTMRAKLRANYWESTRYRDPTTYRMECDKLKQKGVKVLACSTEHDAFSTYEDIAFRTEGDHKHVEISSQAGLQSLENTLFEAFVDMLK